MIRYPHPAFVLTTALAATGCAGMSPSKAPDLSTTPPDYCATLQPYLDQVPKKTGLQVKLQCLSTPGLAEVGFFGRPSSPTERTFDRCFAGADAPPAVSNATAFDFRWTYTATQSLDAGGHASLSSLLSWLPDVTGGAAQSSALHLELGFVGVHFRRISDVAPALAPLKDSAAATSCVQYLCRDQSIYAPTALVGKLRVRIRSASGLLLGVEAKSQNTLGLKVASQDRAEGVLELMSEEDVTIAVVPEPSATMMRDEGLCVAPGAGS